MSFVFLNPIIWLVDTVLGLYTIIIIAAVVASWLIAFGVLNTGNHLVRQIVRDAKSDNYSFGSLVMGVAKSVPFRMRAVPEAAGE